MASDKEKKIEESFLHLSKEEGYKKATTFKDLDQVLYYTVKQLREEIKSLRGTIDEQSKMIESLTEKINNQGADEPNKKSFAQLFEVKSTKVEAAFMSRIRKDLQEEGRIESNIIISGLKTSSQDIGDMETNDKNAVDDLLHHLEIERDNVVRQVRIKTTNDQTNLILVEFKNTETRNKALRSATLRLGKSDKYKGVYVNKDKTRLE